MAISLGGFLRVLFGVGVTGAAAIAIATGVAAVVPAVMADKLYWPVANFICYLSLLRFYLYPKFVRPALRDRSVTIRQAVERSAGLLAGAEQELAIARARLEGVEEEKGQLVRQLEQEGRMLAENIISNAKRAATRIESDAAVQIAAEVANARKEISAQVVALATAMARKKLQAELSLDDDRRLRREALNRLG